MNPFQKRLLLYGTASAAGGLLLVAGFVRPEPAESPEALEFAAKFEMRVGDFAAAKTTAAKLLELEPESVVGHLIEAHSAERVGKLEEALAIYQRVLPKCQNEEQVAEVCIALAALEVNLGRPAEAQGWLDRAKPYHPQAQAKKALASGLAFEAQGEGRKAAEQFLLAADLAQRNRITFHAAVRKLEDLGFLEEAAQAYSRAATGWGDREAKFRLARLKFFSGDADTASAMLRELASVDSRVVESLFRQDEVFRDAMQWEEHPADRGTSR